MPRLGLIYYLTEQINTKALYGKAFRAGTVNETGIDYFDFFVGNPDLKPEHIANLDFGVNYQGKKISLGVNYFHSTQTNSIVQGAKVNKEGNSESINLGGGFLFPIRTYKNIQNFSIQGLEVEGKYYVSKQLYVTSSLLYQKIDADPILVKNLFGGNDTTQIRTPVPNFGFKAGLSYSSDRGVTVSAFTIYQAKLKKDLYPQTGLDPDASKAFNTLNLYINLDMVKLMDMDYSKKFSFFIQHENILNEEIWSNEATTVSPYNQGRALYFGVILGL